MMRRRTTIGLAGVAGVYGLFGAPSARAAPVSVVAARDVRNGWGVCGRPGIDSAPEAYAAMMGTIGTRELRCPVSESGTGALDRIVALRRAMEQQGLSGPAPRVTGLVTAYLNDTRTSWSGQQAILLAMASAGLLRAIEGPNELNNRETGAGSHGPNDRADRTGAEAYPGNARDWAQALQRFRGDNAHALAGVTLVAPSIASGLSGDYAALPNLTGLVDVGNLHFYAGGGRQPSFSIPANPNVGSFKSVFDWARAAQLPQGRMWLTETGASTSGNYAPDGKSQARYVANQLFDLFAAGGERLFFYQLIDGSGRPGDVEGNFGLFRHDGRPKPAAVMLGSLKHLLSRGLFDDPVNQADTAPLPPGYDARALLVSGPSANPSDISKLLLRKSDGSSMLALWNEPPIDDGHGQSLEPPATKVEVDFGSMQTYSVHDLLGPAPLSGTTPSGKPFDAGRTTTVELRGSPQLIELRAPGT